MNLLANSMYSCSRNFLIKMLETVSAYSDRAFIFALGFVEHFIFIGIDGIIFTSSVFKCSSVFAERKSPIGTKLHLIVSVVARLQQKSVAAFV